MLLLTSSKEQNFPFYNQSFILFYRVYMELPTIVINVVFLTADIWDHIYDLSGENHGFIQYAGWKSLPVCLPADRNLHYRCRSLNARPPDQLFLFYSVLSSYLRDYETALYFSLWTNELQLFSNVLIPGASQKALKFMLHE